MTRSDTPSIVPARTHGLYNIASGAWPVVHMPSFEAVFGPKAERWLTRAVGSLMAVNGIIQLTGPRSAEGLEQARRTGLGTAGLLACFDLIYVPAGRTSKMYLLDAVIESLWITAWARQHHRRTRRRRSREER